MDGEGGACTCALRLLTIFDGFTFKFNTDRAGRGLFSLPLGSGGTSAIEEAGASDLNRRFETFLLT
jgi:hypothetical protein